ncbi:MAG: hypothetical protein QM764_22590 [Chitinophagaceae bacterium]
MALPEKNDPFASVRIPEYRNLMMGRFAFIMAFRMMGALLNWWIYELTNASFAIGIIGLSEVIRLCQWPCTRAIVSISVKKGG